MSVNSIIQITGESSNSALYICIMRRYLKLFTKIGQKLYAEPHIRILIQYGLCTEFLVSKFLYIYTALKIMKFNIFLPIIKNMQTTEYGMNSNQDLSIRQHKRIRIYE